MQRYERTSESLMLLLTYLSLVGIWFAIPSLNLYINRDERWPKALFILFILTCFVICGVFVAVESSFSTCCCRT